MIDLEAVVNLIVNNGIGVGCIIYFMYNNNNVMKELKKSIEDMRVLIQKLCDEIDCLKKKEE